MKGALIKDFREKVLELKEKVTDKVFFVSEQCFAYLKNLAAAITKIYDTEIALSLIWDENPDTPAAFATDRHTLTINVNNCYFNAVEGRINKLVVLKALILHECGHLLYTDYHILHSTRKVFCDNRKLFPEPKCEEYKEWLVDMQTISDEDLKTWFSIWKNLENSIEDGFIENMILSTIPGEGQCLSQLRKLQQDAFDNIKVQRNNGLDTPSILFNSILSMAKYNTVKMDADDKDDPAIKELLKNYDTIIAATKTQKSYDRVKLMNTIFVKLYKFMKDEEAKKDNDSQSNEENSADDSNSQSSEENSAGDSNSQSNEENSTGNGNLQSSEEKSNSHNDSQSNEPSSDQTNDGNESTNSSENGCNTPAPSPQNIANNMKDSGMNDEISTDSGSVLNDKNINQQPHENAKNNAEKLNALQNEVADAAKIPTPQDMRAADNIAEQIAENEVNSALEEDLKKNLEQEANNFDFGSINNHTEVKVLRNFPSANAIKIYEEDMKDISFLVKKMVNEIKNKIKDHQQGGKINGLYQGRYLDQHSLSRFDLRMLCKNDLPEDIPNMAISVLIDASGSMQRDKKYVYARRTALLLYHFGKALNIPVMVYSHNVDSTVLLTDLADFNSVDGNDKYRICDLQPYGCNRDGCALRWCSDVLSKRKEETKIMFVISDGRPSDYNSSQDADNDIKGVLLDYSKKHIKYIAVGLGSDQMEIENLYTQNLSPKVAAKFLKTDNPSELPITIVRTIKELIKVS